MKKNDKNILIITIFAIIFLVIWTLSRYNTSTKKAEEIKQTAAIAENQKNTSDDNMDKKQNIPATNVIPTMSPIEVSTKSLTTNNTTIVDMRTVEQFMKKHIRGSVHKNDFDTNTTRHAIVLITDAGDENLLISYYRDLSRDHTVYNLKGGLDAWTQAGLSVIELDTPRNFENVSKVQFVEPRDLNTLLNTTQNENILIIDTRRSGNYQKSHVPGAINIPFVDLEYRYKELPTTKKIYVYGANDETSFRSGVLLHNLNLIGAKTITGGFTAWEKYGYPTMQ